jgi:hypothetical protein
LLDDHTRAAVTWEARISQPVAQMVRRLI